MAQNRDQNKDQSNRGRQNQGNQNQGNKAGNQRGMGQQGGQAGGDVGTRPQGGTAGRDVAGQNDQDRMKQERTRSDQDLDVGDVDDIGGSSGGGKGRGE